MVGEIALIDGGPALGGRDCGDDGEATELSREAVMYALLAELAAALTLLAYLTGLLRQTNRQVEAATVSMLEVGLARLLREPLPTRRRHGRRR